MMLLHRPTTTFVLSIIIIMSRDLRNKMVSFLLPIRRDSEEKARKEEAEMVSHEEAE